MFKDVLKQLRKERHLTQEQLSRELGLAPSSIGNYEQGTRTPKYEVLEMIADYFNVNMDILLSSSNKPYIPKESVAYRIITLMKWKKISLNELAKRTNSDVESLEDYIYNTPDSKFDKNNDLLNKIVDALNTNIDTLFGFNKISDDTYENYISFLYDKLYNDEPMTEQESKTLANYINYSSSNHLLEPEIAEDVITFPVIGEIAAGYNEITIEDWSGDTVDVPASYLKGRKREEFFVLSVHGDSMYPMYLNGDKVLILKQNTLNHSGDVGAILYDGECATLKKVEYVQGEDWLRLVPINPEYQPKLIEGPDLELCRVIGIPKLLIREIEYK